MEPKERLFFNRIIFFLFVIIITVQAGYKEKKSSNGTCSDIVFEKTDTSHIPAVTINITSKALKKENGIYLLNERPFSGHVLEYYKGKKIKSITPVYNGMLHGITRTFYSDGKLKDARSYRENKSYGRHYGFWENGKLKFDFTYYNNKLEGEQKQWYENGQLYLRLHYKNDSETGMQQGWRQNGKLFANYEVKDGIRYGLQKSYLCYTLKNEQIK